MSAVAEQTAIWLEAFTKQPEAAPWVQKLRDQAFARFAELGFPTTHNEEWRFTNVAPIGRVPWAYGPRTTFTGDSGAAESHVGRYASIEHPFVALNTAFLDGVK